MIEFALRNRRIRAAIILAILGMVAPHLGLDETQIQTVGVQLTAAAGAVLLVADYFWKLGPRGLLRVLGGAVGSMPVLYTTIRSMAVQGGVELGDADAAEMAQGIAALAAVFGLSEPIASAVKPNTKTQGSGRLANKRNP